MDLSLINFNAELRIEVYYALHGGTKVKNKLMSILLVVVITLFTDAIIAIANPVWMIDETMILTVFAFPVISFVISVIAYVVVSKFLHTSWLLVIPAVLLSVVASYYAFIGVIHIPGSSEFFTQLANHQSGE